MTIALSRACMVPAPNTVRFSAHNFSKESSRPSRKSRNRTPSSANGAAAAGSEMVRYSSSGSWSLNALNPLGPRAIPARMKATTAGNFKARKTGTTNPAASRNTKASLIRIS